jgi:hypothetical protein
MTDVLMFGQVMTDLAVPALADALERAGLRTQRRESSLFQGGEYVSLWGHPGVVSSLERVEPGEYLARGDADTVDALEPVARALSGALTGLGMRHRLEVYDDDGTLAAYFHHQFPQDEG